MELDKYALVNRILKDVDNIIRKNSELSSFDIVPVDANFRNKSPVLHQQDCLGLESWCIKHVYLVCHGELVDSKPKHKRRRQASLDRDRLVRLLNVALLVHPDMTSLWNRRREMVLEGLLDARSELRFTRLVLSRKAKCNDAFAYRRWILNSMIKDNSTVQSDTFSTLLSEELLVASIAADKCPNNYHGWGHRIWLLQRLAASANVPHSCLQGLYLSEYAHSQRCITRQVSDHSCYHYRQFCVQNVFALDDSHWKEFEKEVVANLRNHFAKIICDNFPNDSHVQASQADLLSFSEQALVQLLLGKALNGCGCEPPYSRLCRQMEILFHELILNDEMIRFYKNHETLWYHRRFILHNLLSIIYEYHGVSRKNSKGAKKSCSSCRVDIPENKAKIVCYGTDCVESSIIFVVLISHDKKVTVERRADGDNYADRHEKYLKFNEGVSL